MDPRVNIFYRQYLQQVKVEKLSFPSGSMLLDPAIQSQIFRYMFTCHFMLPLPPSLPPLSSLDSSSSSGSSSEESAAAFLPPASYQKRVLKELIRRIEAAICDPHEETVSDELMEKMVQLSTTTTTTNNPSEPDAALTTSILTYSLPHHHIQDSSATNDKSNSIFIRESPNVLASAGSTGLRTWDACLHLATYLATTTEGRSLIMGKSVLELGAGTGLLSVICAGPLSAAHVLATDADPNIDETIKTNINLNPHLWNKTSFSPSSANRQQHQQQQQQRQQQTIPLASRVLEWGSASDLTAVLSSLPSKKQERCTSTSNNNNKTKNSVIQYDTILGADITYSPDSLKALASTIHTLAESCPGAQIVIAATIRNAKTFDLFREMCVRQHGLGVYEVDFGGCGCGCCCAGWERQEGLFHVLDAPIRIVRLEKTETG